MVGPATGAHVSTGRGRGTAEAPLRHHPGVAADPSSGRELAIGDRRCAEHLARKPGGNRAPLSRPYRPDLCDHLRFGASLVLVPADAARRGVGFQDLRVAEARPRTVDRAYGL